MEGSIIFYTYGSTLELNGQQFEAGRLTEDLLNLSPDDYHPLHERMVRIRTLMDIYEYVRKSELWWKLNDEMEQLCQELRRYTVFRLLPDDCYDAFFSVIREITGQFSLFPPEEHSLSEDDQTRAMMGTAILKSPWDCWICFVAERAARKRASCFITRCFASWERAKIPGVPTRNTSTAT